MAKEIPGPIVRPFIGNIGLLDPNRAHVSIMELTKTYGPIFQLVAFSNRLVVISDLTLLEKVFNRQELCHRPYMFMREVKYSGSGYMDSNFTAKEKHMKSILWTAIGESLKDEELNELGKKEINSFINSLDAQDDVPFMKLARTSIAKQFASNIIGAEAPDGHADAILDYLDSLRFHFLDGKSGKLSTFPWLRYIPFTSYKASVDWLYRARNQLEATIMEDAKTSTKGIISKMRIGPDASDITQENRNACIMDLLFNMVVPTTENLAFVILQAIKYPDLQEEIHAELANLVGRDNDTDIAAAVNRITPEQAPRTQAFILECMRYLCLVNISLPHYTEEDVEEGGYIFHKGTTILGDFFALQHDEALWENPWEMKPSRFLDDVGRLVPSTDPVYRRIIHFSLGVRACPGRNTALEKIFRHAVAIFGRYRVSSPESSELPTADPLQYQTLGTIQVPAFSCRFWNKQTGWAL